MDYTKEIIEIKSLLNQSLSIKTTMTYFAPFILLFLTSIINWFSKKREKKEQKNNYIRDIYLKDFKTITTLFQNQLGVYEDLFSNRKPQDEIIKIFNNIKSNHIPEIKTILDILEYGQLLEVITNIFLFNLNHFKDNLSSADGIALKTIEKYKRYIKIDTTIINYANNTPYHEKNNPVTYKQYMVLFEIIYRQMVRDCHKKILSDS